MKATTKDRQLENKNRFLALKEAFLDAFEASGGTDGLTECRALSNYLRSNRTEILIE